MYLNKLDPISVKNAKILCVDKCSPVLLRVNFVKIFNIIESDNIPNVISRPAGLFSLKTELVIKIASKI